jgi:hypothetical protein
MKRPTRLNPAAVDSPVSGKLSASCTGACFSAFV